MSRSSVADTNIHYPTPFYKLLTPIPCLASICSLSFIFVRFLKHFLYPCIDTFSDWGAPCHFWSWRFGFQTFRTFLDFWITSPCLLLGAFYSFVSVCVHTFGGAGCGGSGRLWDVLDIFCQSSSAPVSSISSVCECLRRPHYIKRRELCREPPNEHSQVASHRLGWGRAAPAFLLPPHRRYPCLFDKLEAAGQKKTTTPRSTSTTTTPRSTFPMGRDWLHNLIGSIVTWSSCPVWCKLW